MEDLNSVFDDHSEADQLQAGLEHIIFSRQLGHRHEKCRAYILLDAAAAPEITVCLEGFSSGALCLFDGEAKDDLGNVAPWLVEADQDSALWTWFAENGYGNNWGVLLHSRASARELKTSLKRFLEVKNPEGEDVFFKYYRPRNLNTTLPGFTKSQVASFFRHVDGFFAETYVTSRLLNRYSLTESGELKSEVLDLLSISTKTPPGHLQS